jgi:hypothetical protein
MERFGFPPTGLFVGRVGRWHGEFELVEEIVDRFVVLLDEPGGQLVCCGGVAVRVAVWEVSSSATVLTP